MEPVTLFDFEMRAREQLTGMAHDYIAGGAPDKVLLASLNRSLLMPRL